MIQKVSYSAAIVEVHWGRMPVRLVAVPSYFCTVGKEPSAVSQHKVLIEQWRKEYNQVRPHRSLHYRIQPVLVEKRGIRVSKWEKRPVKGS